jgi:hypothetical protein
MLNCKMITPDILEVTELSHSFVDTKVSYWYYNIKTWCQTQTGNKDSYLTENMVKMNTAAIIWVQKWYLTKV